MPEPTPHYPTWFGAQLRSSADALSWAIGQIPPARHRVAPPADAPYLGDWPPLRHVWHVAYYERCIVVPAIRACMGGPAIPDDPCPDWERWDAFADRSVDDHLADLHAVRADQLALLDGLVDADWTTPRETAWGTRPLTMIFTKTLQHTFEHTDTVLRMALRWPEDG